MFYEAFYGWILKSLHGYNAGANKLDDSLKKTTKNGQSMRLQGNEQKPEVCPHTSNFESFKLVFHA